MAQKGVRTESWTAGRSGLEVRMYSREKVELFLLATEDGMGPTVSVNVTFTIFTNVFSPIAPTRMRRIRQRGCAAFGA